MCRETLQLEDGAATLNDRSDHCHHCVWQHAGLMEGVNGKGNVSPHPFVEHFSPQTTPNTWWIDWHQTVLHYPRQSLLQLLTTSTFKSLLLARILHAEDGTSVPFLVVLLFRVKPYFWYFHLLIFLDFLKLEVSWSFLASLVVLLVILNLELCCFWLCIPTSSSLFFPNFWIVSVSFQAF